MLKKIFVLITSNWLDLLSIFVLVFCGIKLVYQVPQFLDLIPTDDAHYMQYGFKFPKKYMPILVQFIVLGSKYLKFCLRNQS
jgi:hypothetical protein